MELDPGDHEEEHALDGPLLVSGRVVCSCGRFPHRHLPLRMAARCVVDAALRMICAEVLMVGMGSWIPGVVRSQEVLMLPGKSRGLS